LDFLLPTDACRSAQNPLRHWRAQRQTRCSGFGSPQTRPGLRVECNPGSYGHTRSCRVGGDYRVGKVFVSDGVNPNVTVYNESTGLFINQFVCEGNGTHAYPGLAIFNETLWAGGEGFVDVFNLITKSWTTKSFDNGQQSANSMYYSATTNTVLITLCVHLRLGVRLTHQ